MDIMGIGFIVFGIYVSLVGYGKIQASKNPEKNKEWLEKYGKRFKLLGPCLIVIGIIKLLV